MHHDVQYQFQYLYLYQSYKSCSTFYTSASRPIGFANCAALLAYDVGCGVEGCLVRPDRRLRCEKRARKLSRAVLLLHNAWPPFHTENRMQTAVVMMDTCVVMPASKKLPRLTTKAIWMYSCGMSSHIIVSRNVA